MDVNTQTVKALLIELSERILVTNNVSKHVLNISKELENS